MQGEGGALRAVPGSVGLHLRNPKPPAAICPGLSGRGCTLTRPLQPRRYHSRHILSTSRPAVHALSRCLYGSEWSLMRGDRLLVLVGLATPDQNAQAREEHAQCRHYRRQSSQDFNCFHGLPTSFPLDLLAAETVKSHPTSFLHHRLPITVLRP